MASPKLALGRVRAVSRVLGDPRWRGADLFLSLHNILPVRYPLDGFSISEILALENYAGRLIDYGVMLPRIQALYAFAAADLGRAPAARLRPGRPARLRVDQRRGSPVDDDQVSRPQVDPDLADLVLRIRLSA